MGALNLHQHSEICAISVDRQYSCPNCQLFFSMFDRYIDPDVGSCPFCIYLFEFLFYICYSFWPLFLGWCVISGNAPLTAVQLLWVNMIMDTLGALALATEPPNDDLMKRSPVGRKGNFISNVMWRNIIGMSLYQFVVIWILQTRGTSFFHLDGEDSDLILNTIIFNSFVFCQVTNTTSIFGSASQMV